MALNVAKEVAALQRMTAKQLREKYAAVFGEPTAANNKPWLVRRIAWRLQALAEGDLSERARGRAAELARDADLRLNPPADKPAGKIPAPAPAPAVADTRLPPGTILTRRYKDGVIRVTVLADGFEYASDVYRSLSAVARMCCLSDECSSSLPHDATA